MAAEENKKLLKDSGINCVDLDYSIGPQDSIVLLGRKVLEAEQKVFEMIKPSIVIEDNCFTSPLISEKIGAPRITVQRTFF